MVFSLFHGPGQRLPRHARPGVRCRVAPLALGLLGALGLSHAGAAVVPPPIGAGQLDNQLRQSLAPPPAAPMSPALALPADTQGRASAPASPTRVTLNQIRFRFDNRADATLGIKGITPADLQKAAAPWLHRPLSFAELQTMAETLTQYVRQRGALLARVRLAPQTIKGGVLTLHLSPGRYDQAALSNHSRLRDSQARCLAATAAPPGQVVTRASLERLALLLGEVPGTQAQVTLRAGALPGTSQPDITLTPGARFGGYLGLDNQGDPTTGRSRVLAGAYANGMLGYGDQLRVDLLAAYEQRNLFNGGLDYSLLLGGAGTRVGISYSRLNYHYRFLQRDFRGDADNGSVYLSHPWIRTARARVDVRLEGSQQWLTDNYPADLYLGLGARGQKRVSLGSFALSGSALTVAGGVSSFSLRGSVGSMNYRDVLSQEINFSRELGSGGRFARLNYALNHDQPLWGPFSLYANLAGQSVNRNLDSSQKWLLGGPGAVRAYDVGAGAVDRGTLATLEARWRQTLPASRWLGHQPSVTLAAFYDQGWGEQYRQNRNAREGGALTAHNHVNLAGAGVYATLAQPGSYALTLTWARRSGQADPVSGLTERNRVWLSALKAF